MKEEPADQVMAAEGEGSGERGEAMVEYERFKGKKMEKRGGKTNKYKDCHPESQEMEGRSFLLPSSESAERG